MTPDATAPGTAAPDTATPGAPPPLVKGGSLAPILERSFVLLDRVGERTERRIWEQGVRHWDHFLDRHTVGPFSPARKAEADAVLERAKEALRSRDAGFFQARLGGPHMWRLYPTFAREAAFVDIETTGISRHNAITVVGVLRGDRFTHLVRFRDLTRRELSAVLDDAPLLVTYNGAGFDLPMLRLHYPVPELMLPHVDLRFVAHRVGLHGGLKRIERAIGVVRDREFAMMTGEDAVHLWHLWERTGNARALDLLLRYNRADVVNMRAVADHVCAESERRILPLVDL